MTTELLSKEGLQTYVLGNIDNDFEIIYDEREMTANEADEENREMIRKGISNRMWIKKIYL